MTTFYGPSAPSSIALRGDQRIGRDTGADIVIDDDAISREHALIHAGGEAIEDLGSSNGTWVDGARATGRVPLRDGAIVRAGRTLLRVGVRTEPWAPADAGPLVGGSALARVRRQIGLVAPTPLSVLILGETGTGKDIAARLLHEGSGRAGAFVAVNCAALPEQLADTELFGHARAAFTGAAQARSGLFAAADGGTLFLDEVGELPPATQAKLLRVLEDGLVRPVGSARAQRVDVRVVSATNRDLAARVRSGEFRADLLARLASVELRLPALRERPEDLPALAAHLLARAGQPRSIDVEAMELLALHAWPLNVRELDNVLRSAALAEEGPLSPSSIAPRLVGPRDMSPETPREDTPRRDGDTEQADLERALRKHRGNVRRASREIGLSRAHFYRLLKRWSLDPASFRGP
ncbi:PEP-CTERM-box response regulator transcription factor [Sandaracinus amylolyticus]|nr:PEP-CTERM-box response regulator transcription factor [Sandaracinus amylolyticus]